ncbi:MAG: hypothetical protein U0800_03550 [Isosphaeraceae bacterium]
MAKTDPHGIPIDSHGIPGNQLRAEANAPEVHAAAIRAAKEYILARGGDTADVGSDQMMATIGLHAAILMRTYLDAIGHEGLALEVARSRSPRGTA